MSVNSSRTRRGNTEPKYTVQTMVRLTPVQRLRLEMFCASNDRSIGWVLREAMIEFLDRNETKIEKEEDPMDIKKRIEKKIAAGETQADIAEIYADGLVAIQRHEILVGDVPWAAINKAIVERWSRSGLDAVKSAAWTLSQGRAPNSKTKEN